MLNLLFSLLLFTSQAPITFASSFYLAPNGNDSADGSLKTPWKSLQKAIWKIKAGDTIFIREGTYRDSSYADLSKSSTGAMTSIRSYNREKVIFDGRVQPYEALRDPLIRKKDNLWEGFTNKKWRNLDGLWINSKFYPRVENEKELKKGSWYLEKKSGRVLVHFETSASSNKPKLEFRMEAMITVDTPYWIIEGITANYYNFAGIAVWKTHHVTIKNCETHYNGGSGIEADEASDLLIEHNHTSYNGAEGGPGWASGIHLWKTTSPNNIVRNNLSHHNWDPSDHHTDGNGFSIDRGKEQGGAEVYNNIAYSNGGRGIDVVEVANVKLHHNTFYNNSQDPLIHDQGEVSISEEVSTKGFEFHDNVLLARRKNRPFVAFGKLDLKSIKGDYNLIYNLDSPNLAFAHYGQKKFSFTEWQNLFKQEMSSLNLDPKLVDPEKGEFAPNIRSPLLGKGSGKHIPEKDFSNKIRQTNHTIGALEP